MQSRGRCFRRCAPDDAVAAQPVAEIARVQLGKDRAQIENAAAFGSNENCRCIGSFGVEILRLRVAMAAVLFGKASGD